MAEYDYDDYECSVSGSDQDDRGLLTDDDDDGIAMEQNETQPPKDPAKDCVALSNEALMKEMTEMIKEVSQIMRISPGATRILLHQNHWNKENLMEKYYDCADGNKFLVDARVNPAKLGPKLQGIQAECNICCRIAVLMGLACHHGACALCWERYLITKILQDNTSEIECLDSNCRLIIDDETIRRLLGKNEKAERAFSRLTINAYVESNRLLRWCPGLDCGKAIKVPHCEPREVECDCGNRCCFECGHEWHEPVNCRLLKLWMKKCIDDSETGNWINANTKECPKCQVSIDRFEKTTLKANIQRVTIEKDGGCNHMTCKNSACRQEFCWMCLGPWEPHGSAWYLCNRFDDSDSKKARDAQDLSRAALNRYLHYCNRFMNHQQSLKLEYKLYSSVKVKMQQMQRHSMSWIEVQFLKKAVDVLSQCRRTLMYTYAFAFYLEKDNQSMIFEDNQKDLEMATEQLSEFLERDMENENLSTLKQKVQDKYRYVEQRRALLLKHCAEGADKDTWNFNS